MKFPEHFTDKDKIQLLQRSILVNSFAYYELNSNILTDFQYDDNAKQLKELKRRNPTAFENSRYNIYFKDFCSDSDNLHYTSGFDLLEAVKKNDKDLYRYIWIDAELALRLKSEKRLEDV